jgi:hypothetical protein
VDPKKDFLDMDACPSETKSPRRDIFRPKQAVLVAEIDDPKNAAEDAETKDLTKRGLPTET